jgi:hypothetical protein
MKILIYLFAFAVLQAGPIRAQDPVTIIKEGVTQVIKALDLQIQRIQTQTIWLQEAQKEVENALSALRLDEIRDWVQQQKDLYAGYFQELWQVKVILSSYNKVETIVQRQKDILAGYQQAMALFRQDKHFTVQELEQMEAVYAGILAESGKNLEQLGLVINSFITQMPDEKRMSIIDDAAAGMDKNYRDMQVYTNQNAMLSIQRGADENEIKFLKKIYGL